MINKKTYSYLNKNVKYDIEFNKTTMLQKYNEMNPKPENNIPKSGNLLSTYYKKYGYTSLIATATGFLAGTNSATNIAENLLGTLVPGTTRNSVGSFLLNTGKTILRDPLISSTLNSYIPSTNLLGIAESKITPAQLIPGEILLAKNNLIKSNFSSMDLITSSVKSTLTSILSGVSTTGTATKYDLNRVFENGLDTTNKIMLAQQGLKYTKNTGFLGPKQYKFNGDKEISYQMTFDKYSGYKDDDSKYSSIVDNSNIDKSELIQQYYIKTGNKIPQFNLSTFADTNPSKLDLNLSSTSPLLTSNYNNNNAQKYDTSDNPYSKRQEIVNYVKLLGYPRVDGIIDPTSDESLDKINKLDINEMYTEDLRDSIKFIFEDMTSESLPVPIIFRSTISNLSDTITPEWNEHKYVGRADTFYTYTGFTRTITFNFVSYVNSVRELPYMWRKLNRLYGMCYPVAYENNIAMRAPIVRLTIGDMYSGIYGKFDSLTLSPHDESFWEVEDGYQLPHIVDISVSFTVMYEPNDTPPITKSHHFINDKSRIKFKSKFTEDLIENT